MVFEFLFHCGVVSFEKKKTKAERKKKKEKRFSFGSCFNDNKVPVSLSMETTSFFPKNQLQKEKIQK